MENLIQTTTKLAIHIAGAYVRPESLVIDATFGNGGDTLQLAAMNPARPIAFDREPEAVRITREKLTAHGYAKAMCYAPHSLHYLIMIINDHSRLITGGQIFYHDNAYNYQKVLKQALSAYSIPDKIYMNHGSSFENEQLTLILDSLAIVEFHAPLGTGLRRARWNGTSALSAAAGFPLSMFQRSIPSKNSTNFLLSTYVSTTQQSIRLPAKRPSTDSFGQRIMSVSQNLRSSWMSVSPTG